MSQVQLFSHPDLGELKATIRNGEPWFLAGDVCRVLGIKDSAKAVRDVESKYKSAGLEVTTSSRTLIQTAGGKQQAVIITEQVLYELIFNSRKQKAVLFRAWVAGEVLPSIRKHGFYRAEQSNKDNAGKPAHFPTIEVVYDYDVDTYAGNTYTFGDVEQV